MTLIHALFFFLVVSASDKTKDMSGLLPDYQSEATPLFIIERCKDGSTTTHFITNSPINFYIVDETITNVSNTFIKIVKIQDGHRIRGRMYFIKDTNGKTEKVDSERWDSRLEKEAPEYFLFLQNKGGMCEERERNAFNFPKRQPVTPDTRM